MEHACVTQRLTIGKHDVVKDEICVWARVRSYEEEHDSNCVQQFLLKIALRPIDWTLDRSNSMKIGYWRSRVYGCCQESSGRAR